MKKLLIVAACLLSGITNYAQAPFWALGMGSPSATIGDDEGHSCFVSPNGNVLVAGKFSGTMDVDPGAGVYNITSVGNTDAFVACYNSTGGFLWGFAIGGVDNDGAYRVTADASDNVIVTGFFQTSADFDPGAGTVTLTSAGGTGSSASGDGFVAKYSSSGSFLWAKQLGGVSVWDYTDVAATDAAGNVYVGGEFSATMIVSSSITLNSATDGVGYMVKYDPAGTVVWAHAFGETGISAVTTSVRGMRISAGFIYICGSFKGTANFNPWGTAATLVAGASNADGYIAKYDVGGNFVFVRGIAGPGMDDAVMSLDLDASNNIYVGGVFNGANIVLNPLSPGTGTFTAPGGGTGFDFFVAKYNSTGGFLWGNAFGGPGEDFHRTGIGVFGSSVYVPGWFNNTVDFDPSGSVATLTSTGNSDIFLARYDLNGNYVCAFRVGTATVADEGYEVAHSLSGEIYYTGRFGGAATDFDPTSSTLPLTSAGGTDIFLAKYDVCGSVINPGCDSIILADTIHVCIGDTVTLPASLYGVNTVLSKLWTPAAGLSDPTILNPVLTVTTSGYYKLTVRSLIDYNQVDNGDFNDGNTGFSSSYTYSAPPSSTLVEGDYSVYTNPNGVHSGFTVMGDHTTGTGNMMIINAGPTPVDVWCQTITVIPNTDYDFSAWFANCSSATVPPDIPTLQFRINGVLQGVPTPVSSAPGVWVNFSTTWNSGPSTTATICIYDATTVAAGNDFVIDDISFRQHCVISDSVWVDVNIPDTTYVRHDTALCGSSFPITLAAPTGFISTTWSSGGTTATMSVGTGGTYWVRSEAAACHFQVDTFKVTSHPMPFVYLGHDTAFCNGGVYVVSSPQPAGSSWHWSTGSVTDTIHVSTTGSYSVIVTNSDGCSDSDVVNVMVTDPPVVNLGPDTTECFGHSFVISSSVTYTAPAYLWQDASFAPVYTVTTSGTYWLQVTEYGCSGADTIHVEIKWDTFTVYNPDTAICKGKSVLVRATGDPNISFQWRPTTGMPNSAMINPLITPDTSAKYVLTAQLAGCPDRTASFYVDVQPNPDPFLGVNRHVCEFDSVQIHSFVDPGWYKHYSYHWWPGTAVDDSTLTAVVFRPGVMTNLKLTVSTPIGCSGTDSVMIIVHPGNFASGSGDTAICPKQPVRLSVAGGVAYKWIPDTYLDDAVSASPIVNAITDQRYSVVATSEFGCRDTLTMNITVHPAAVMNMPDSVVIFSGESYQISPQTNGTKFSWTPSGGLNGKFISNPLATPEMSTLYRVAFVTEYGCTATDSIYVNINDNGLIAVPNAFTPGAGINDRLFAQRRGAVNLKSFRIYNRWGSLVFQTSSFDEGWDGTYKGVPQPLGVFVYTIEAETEKGKTIMRTGNVTLLR